MMIEPVSIERAPIEPAPLPVTVVGGYLGAGKTTLINRLLQDDHGLRLAVLVNDFGEVNIDARLIAAHDGETWQMTNGCICCSIGDDFSETMLRVARTEPRPDAVVVEASGVADATRFATYAGEWLGFALRAIIVVADAETVRSRSEDRYVGDLVVRQLEAADLIVLNKADLVDASALADVRHWMRTIEVTAPVVETTQADLPPNVFFGDIEQVHRGDRAKVEVDHASGFSTALIRDDLAWNRNRLEDALEQLPDSIVRFKGTVILDDATSALVLQGVGRRWQLTESKEPYPGQTELVLIGLGDQATTDAAASAIVATCRNVVST